MTTKPGEKKAQKPSLPAISSRASRGPSKHRRTGDDLSTQTYMLESTRCPPQKRLPVELLLQILNYLQHTDILNFRLVCKYFSIVPISSIFRSVQLSLSHSRLNETGYPFFYTGLFYRLADEITITANKPEEPGQHNTIHCTETGLLSRTTSVLDKLSKITLDMKEFDRTKPLYYGTFFVQFFDALYADFSGKKIKSLTINNLPLWALQMLRKKKPTALRHALTEVKQLSLSFVPILAVDVDDTVNFYSSYQSFTSADRNQLHAAYDAVRALLISAKKVEELDFSWFSVKSQVAKWKALSPIGDLTSLCKPAAGADAARFMLIGGLSDSTSWVDSEGKFTVAWQSLRVLKLSKLITCSRQLLTAIIGAKETLKELELSKIRLNRSCGSAVWYNTVILPLSAAMITRNGQEMQFRLEKCVLSQLGYTSGLGLVPDATLVSWAEYFVS